MYICVRKYINDFPALVQGFYSYVRLIPFLTHIYINDFPVLVQGLYIYINDVPALVQGLYIYINDFPVLVQGLLYNPCTKTGTSFMYI
jgi:hypothetical protein